jgi:hypothetical protein
MDDNNLFLLTSAPHSDSPLPYSLLLTFSGHRNPASNLPVERKKESLSSALPMEIKTLSRDLHSFNESILSSPSLLPQERLGSMHLTRRWPSINLFQRTSRMFVHCIPGAVYPYDEINNQTALVFCSLIQPSYVNRLSTATSVVKIPREIQDLHAPAGRDPFPGDFAARTFPRLLSGAEVPP